MRQKKTLANHFRLMNVLIKRVYLHSLWDWLDQRSIISFLWLLVDLKLLFVEMWSGFFFDGGAWYFFIEDLWRFKGFSSGFFMGFPSFLTWALKFLKMETPGTFSRTFNLKIDGDAWYLNFMYILEDPIRILP